MIRGGGDDAFLGLPAAAASAAASAAALRDDCIQWRRSATDN